MKNNQDIVLNNEFLLKVYYSNLIPIHTPMSYKLITFSTHDLYGDVDGDVDGSGYGSGRGYRQGSGSRHGDGYGHGDVDGDVDGEECGGGHG